MTPEHTYLAQIVDQALAETSRSSCDPAESRQVAWVAALEAHADDLSERAILDTAKAAIRRERQVIRDEHRLYRGGDAGHAQRVLWLDEMPALVEILDVEGLQGQVVSGPWTVDDLPEVMKRLDPVEVDLLLALTEGGGNAYTLGRERNIGINRVRRILMATGLNERGAPRRRDARPAVGHINVSTICGCSRRTCRKCSSRKKAS